MSRILITGATGYIGKRLTQYLAEKGHIVHAVCRTYSEDFIQHNNINYEVLGEHRSLETVFASHRFDEVFHLAAYYSHSICDSTVDDLIECNISFGISLLRAMQRYDCRRLINMTTCAEFDHFGEYSPNSLYAASKRAFRDFAQYYVNCAALNIVDLVLYDNYGPQDPRPKIIQLLCKHLDSVSQIKLSSGEQKLNLVHIDDTVRAIELAAKCIGVSYVRGSKKLYCVAPPQPVSLRELAATIEAVSGKKISALWGGKPYRENEIMVPWRGETVPGWTAEVSLQEGLKELL